MNEKYEKAKALTKEFGQEHLLAFYDELTAEEQMALVDQILY